MSLERLGPYRRDGCAIGKALERYQWNLALSEALYPTLQCLEVGLRNVLHREMSALYGTGLWMLPSARVLLQREADQVQAVVQRLGRGPAAVTANRIVAEASFGFWTALLDRPYEMLWRRLLKGGFPNVPRSSRTRTELSRRLNSARRLRNRVFHHEPVWHWTDLRDQHQMLVETVGWLSPLMADLALKLDRFPAVEAARPA